MAYRSNSAASDVDLALRLAHHPGHAVVRPPAAERVSAWRTSSQVSYRSNSAASELGLARFGLCIVRTMQPLAERDGTAECVAKGKLARGDYCLDATTSRKSASVRASGLSTVELIL
jgi:hypothetical protein